MRQIIIHVQSHIKDDYPIHVFAMNLSTIYQMFSRCQATSLTSLIPFYPTNAPR